jgi:hypothetical protein
MSRGNLADGHCLINSGGGGREAYLERTIGPCTELIQSGLWRTHPLCAPDTAEMAAKQQRVGVLLAVSEHLPTVVLGAYSLSSRQQLGEALLDAWIAVEQILDYKWGQYVSGIEDSRRRERLGDTRTYTAAVRSEILLTAGRLSAAEYVAVTAARQERNAFAHRVTPRANNP